MVERTMLLFKLLQSYNVNNVVESRLTNHEVDNDGEDRGGDYAHRDHITEHFGQEVSRHSVEATRVLMTVTRATGIRLDYANADEYAHMLMNMQMFTGRNNNKREHIFNSI